MSSTELTFCLKSDSQNPQDSIDASPLIPSALENQSIDEIRRLLLRVGNRELPTGDLFDITGHDHQSLRFVEDCSRIDSIGENLDRGTIRIYGNAGNRIGAGMRGGQILVDGNAKSFVATGIRGGTLRVSGNAGNRLTAPEIGQRMGMQGGQVLIGGDAGDFVGQRMRRGILLVQGSVGAYCAAEMVAGTLGFAGSNVGQPGIGMRRGTIVMPQLLDNPQEPRFTTSRKESLGFLTLLRNEIGRFFPEWATTIQNECYRKRGDLSVQGLGELLGFALSDSEDLTVDR